MSLNSDDDLDGYGQADWSNIATNEPCKLLFKPAGDTEKVRSWEETSVSNWECYFNLGVDIRPADRVTIKGKTFEVLPSNAGATDAVLLLVPLILIGR